MKKNEVERFLVRFQDQSKMYCPVMLQGGGQFSVASFRDFVKLRRVLLHY